MIGTAPDAILVVGANGACVLANSAAGRIVGQAVPDLQGRNLRDLGPWGDRVLMAAEPVLATGEPGHAEVELAPGGSIVDAALSRFLLGGEPHLLVICHDVTERKRQEARCAQAERRAQQQSMLMEALVENMPVPVFYKDAEGRYLGCNRAFEIFFGSPKAALAGKTVFDIAPPENARRYHQADEELLQAGGTQVYEWNVRRGTGEDRRVIFYKACFFRPDGMVGGLVGAVLDITDKLAVEEELRRSNTDLEQFAYVISHDLRQPLRMVSGYLGLIEKRLGTAIGDEVREYLDFALGGAKRMNRMITDLLEYSRIGRGSPPLEATPLADAVADSLLNLALAIAEAGAEIVVTKGLPAIRGDRTELTRLFQNLIGNAITYRRPGQAPRITVGHRDTEEARMVWVEDNGIGIPVDERDRAFAIFHRLAPADAYEGTGIGLALCKKIIERHGGRIWVDDTPGGGCTFSMAFPK